MQKPLKPIRHTSPPPLRYVKLILAKVSFDASIFKRELYKAVNVLLPHEIKSLEQWCYHRFGDTYQTLLDECFANHRMMLI